MQRIPNLRKAIFKNRRRRMANSGLSQSVGNASSVRTNRSRAGPLEVLLCLFAFGSVAAAMLLVPLSSSRIRSGKPQFGFGKTLNTLVTAKAVADVEDAAL